MHLGVDASSIRAGGGVTHLVELLRAARPEDWGFDRVIVWSGANTLHHIERRPWLQKMHCPPLDRSLPMRVYWQRFVLDRLARRLGCDLLFVPGGTYTGTFHPFATMSRNLLPFDPYERARFGPLTQLRFHLLERAQRSTFRRADGVIFLTKTAKQLVEARTGLVKGVSAVIPHGVSNDFRALPRRARPLGECSPEHPFRWLYVSTVNPYKHQWHVAEAIAWLRAHGLPVALDLIGSSTPKALQRLRITLVRLDPAGEFIRYHGHTPYDQLALHYHRADAFAFASSCETFGQILLEAMAAGLPIACSDRSAMPEILGDAGVYFDPERPDTIAQAMSALMESAALRDRLAAAAYERSLSYSWERCSRETFQYLAQVVRRASEDN